MLKEIQSYFEKVPPEKRKKRFKNACIVEGVTCILLFLVAMPVKYQFGIWWQMIPVGILHGAAFMWYLVQLPFVKNLYQWDDEDYVFAILSAFFPFATFWVEKKLI